MAYLNRRTFIASALAASTATTALGRSQPWAEELSAYSVRDPMAGYFDFAKRRKLIQTVVDPVLQAARVKLNATPRCLPFRFKIKPLFFRRFTRITTPGDPRLRRSGTLRTPSATLPPPTCLPAPAATPIA